MVWNVQFDYLNGIPAALVHNGEDCATPRADGYVGYASLHVGVIYRVCGRVDVEDVIGSSRKRVQFDLSPFRERECWTCSESVYVGGLGVGSCAGALSVRSPNPYE